MVHEKIKRLALILALGTASVAPAVAASGGGPEGMDGFPSWNGPEDPPTPDQWAEELEVPKHRMPFVYRAFSGEQIALKLGFEDRASAIVSAVGSQEPLSLPRSARAIGGEFDYVDLTPDSPDPLELAIEMSRRALLIVEVRDDDFAQSVTMVIPLSEARVDLRHLRKVTQNVFGDGTEVSMTLVSQNGFGVTAATASFRTGNPKVRVNTSIK